MAALEAGATGYLPKDSPPDEILAAILRAGRGERYLSPSLIEKLLAGTTHAGLKKPHDALSRRETEVMILLSRGLSLNAIGGALFLSPKTISTYRARVLEKLNLRSNADLTRYVIEHQLDAQDSTDSPSRPPEGLHPAPGGQDGRVKEH
jgi:DNA-binding NarL/FixJ family response regulator